MGRIIADIGHRRQPTWIRSDVLLLEIVAHRDDFLEV